MLRVFAILLLSCLFIVHESDAEDLNPCPSDSVSKKVRNQTAKWEDRMRWSDESQNLLRQVDSELAKKTHEDCDLARLKIARLNIIGASDDPAQSIPALEEVILITDTSNNPAWLSSLVNLSYQYQALADFDDLAKLSLDHMDQVTGDEWLVLSRSLMIAQIGQGRIDDAYVNLVQRINNNAESISRWDLTFGYSLANHLGRRDDAVAFQTIADANFGSLWNPDPLPRLEGDILTHLLARETNEIYQMEVIRNPKPDYPIRAAEKGIEGQCDVQFDIDTKGKPQNVQAICTHPYFIGNSEKAIRKMRFEPLSIDGTLYEMPDYVYPLEYRLAN